MYYVSSADPNKPPGVTDGSLFVTSYSTALVNQIYMDWRTNRTYRRSRANGVWSPWVELYTHTVTSGAASVTSANWYRIARLTGPTGRGDGIVSIYTTGGSYAPYTAVIKYHKTWSNFGGLIVEAMTSVGYWSGVRLTQDAVDTSLFYLEVYITRPLDFMVSTMPSLGYPSPPEILTGNLQIGGGTVITSIPNLNVGINATV
jgi:hypothetical protein